MTLVVCYCGTGYDGGQCPDCGEWTPAPLRTRPLPAWDLLTDHALRFGATVIDQPDPGYGRPECS